MNRRNIHIQRALLSSVCALAMSSGASAESATPAQDRSGKDATEVEEILVTATRRTEALSDVPVSVAAFSNQKLDAIGAREVDDIARLTPGVRFERESFGAGNRSSIAIRGVSSGVGAGTVGVYIDDTPIQVRNIYYSTTNAYPRLFDLERVEILRGPQGTLFGAGSEGGTVRFITPSPDLNEAQTYARGELAFTRYGDPSYEVGVAQNIPVVEDKVAVRLSAWHRKDGGWIDRVDVYDPNRVLAKDENSGEATSARIAVAFAPTENLTITPSFYYQEQKLKGGNTYWLSISDPGDGVYRNASLLGSPGQDKFGIGAVALTWNLGSVDLVTNTSFFKRKSDFRPDYTGTGFATLTGDALPPYRVTGTRAFWLDDQKNFTQEVRLQSADDDARLSWVVGGFYSKSDQRARQMIDGGGLARVLEYIFGFPIGIEDVFGQGLTAEGFSYVTNDKTEDEQFAGFGQVDYKLTEQLTVTAGVRVSRTKFSFVSATDGPYLGTASLSGATAETPVTPKIGLSYKTANDALIYASASKGFRVGGAQRPAPVTCASDLQDLGITQTPRTYESDSVWSYELGAKGTAFDRRVQFEASVFQIDWKNIQQSVALPNCNLSYIDNLGSARSRGFDLAVTARPVSALTLGLAVGYTDAEYQEDVAAVPPLYIVRKGDTLGQRPWTVYANAQYDFEVGSTEAYVRADYSYESHNDQANAVDRISYDPRVPRPPATHQVNLRAGADVSGADISVFVDNLFDAKTNFGLNRDTVTSSVFYGGSFRPRTVGVTVTYRK